MNASDRRGAKAGPSSAAPASRSAPRGARFTSRSGEFLSSVDLPLFTASPVGGGESYAEIYATARRNPNRSASHGSACPPTESPWADFGGSGRCCVGPAKTDDANSRQLDTSPSGGLRYLPSLVGQSLPWPDTSGPRNPKSLSLPHERGTHHRDVPKISASREGSVGAAALGRDRPGSRALASDRVAASLARRADRPARGGSR